MSMGIDETIVAAEDLSTYQYQIIVNSTTGAGRAGTSGAQCAGVVQNKPKANEAANVRCLGRSRVRAGGTIALGDNFSATASGTAQAANSGDYIVGNAITNVASGGFFDGMITHAGFKG